MRDLIRAFEVQFNEIDRRSRDLLSLLTDDALYQRPRRGHRRLTPFSCGEYLLRSAAAVEQTFGGLTRRLWDDPFEWTLPEKLPAITDINGYLDEVAHTASQGLKFLSADSDLGRSVETPVGLQTIHELLLKTVSRSSHLQGRAYAIFQVLSDQQPPRL